MPILQIEKVHDNGIVITDKIKFETKEDGYTWLKVVAAKAAAGTLPWCVRDYSWALIGSLATAHEVIENPTQGYIGKLKK